MSFVRNIDQSDIVAKSLKGAPSMLCRNGPGEAPAPEQQPLSLPCGCTGPFASLHVFLLAAHPDDEVLGAGGQFATMRRLTLMHLTNGTSSQAEAWRRGWPTRSRYAQYRLAESMRAISLSGVEFGAGCLNAPDRKATADMDLHVLRLASLLRIWQPDVLLTHAYEGGHPDHDAAAFVAQAVCELVPGVPRWEMTSYHAAHASPRPEITGAVGNVAVETARFLLLPGGAQSPREIEVPLDSQRARVKRRMLACFESQLNVLADIGAQSSVERFRQAPVYDFWNPPHPGQLLYESQSWVGMTGAHWRGRARKAASILNSYREFERTGNGHRARSHGA